MVAGETWADVLEAERKTGRKATSRDFEDVTWMLRTLGRTYSAGEFAAAVRRIKRVGFEIAAFMQGHAADILLSPTLASPPIPIGAILPRGFNAQMQRFLGRLGLGALMRAFAVLEHAAQGAFAFAPYTPVFNATGQPSMSVPLCWNAEGLPIGLLFTGRYGEDANLLRLAAQLEEARPWKDRKPPVCGEN
jgi:amidase